MLSSHQSRVYTLSVMLVTLLLLIAGTVWGMHLVNKDIRTLKKRTRLTLIETAALERMKSHLEANIGLSTRLSRIDRLQKRNLPELRHPSHYVRLEDLPYPADDTSVSALPQNTSK